MKVSVIITNRNEKMLEYTIRQLRAKQCCETEIIVVDDRSTRQYNTDGIDLVIQNDRVLGNCPSRDKGIMAAKHDIVMISDAHMDFADDGQWQRNLADYIQQNPTHIACAVSGVTSEAKPDYDDMTGCYYGARIALITAEQGIANRHRIFPSHWNGPDISDEVKCGRVALSGSILGGFYCLSRQRYIDIGRPWQYLHGWGTSEQNIAIPNWMQGGESVVSPAVVAHQYRTGQQPKVPYSTRLWHIFYNQLWLAHMVIDDDDFRDYVIGTLKRDIEHSLNQAMITAEKELHKTDWRWIRGQRRDRETRTFEQYKETWMDKYE